MRTTTFCLLLAVVCYCVDAIPIDDKAFVAATTIPTDKTDKEHHDDSDNVVPKIYKMHIHSRIENRYANTTVTSKVRNLAKKAQEATFFVVLPDSAFISGFVMEIDGKNYTAYVQEKKKAQETYDQAVSQGISAAHVAVTARDSNKFTVSVNVEPQKKATFYLYYEELLKRANGYEMIVNIHPKQPVADLRVDVEIVESSPLKYVRAPPLRSGNDVSEPKGNLDSRAKIDKGNSTYALVSFEPSAERQKEYAQAFGTKEDEGLSGQFVVQYDVERENNGGEIILKDGHFVHFFAPDNEQKLPKYIIFVLDTSGSMYGDKLPQLKQAMLKILPDLNENDAFSLVEFNSMVKVWDIEDYKRSGSFPEESRVWNYDSLESNYNNVSFPAAYRATKENIDKAKDVINGYQADGGTNIYEALKIAKHLYDMELKRNKDYDKQPIVVFLTDGDPTVGVTNSEEIVTRLSDENAKRIPIFSLSFGFGADQQFLRKLSLKNSAFSRHIYEASDASLQLENFYKQISSPLLRNVHFKYTKDAEDVSHTRIPIFFMGAECVVVGRVPTNGFDQVPEVEAIGIRGPIVLRPVIKQTTYGELERVWAYLTIKQLLDDKETAKNKTDYDKKALDLALKYSFVTPVSSLVVVKPNDTKPVDTEVADKITPKYKAPAIPLSLPGPRRGNPFLMQSSAVSTYSRKTSPVDDMSQSGIPLSGFQTQLALARPPIPSTLSFASYGGAQGFPGPIGASSFDVDMDSVVNKAHIITTPLTISSPFDDLISKLPWLNAILNRANNSIDLDSGNYKLGFDAVVDQTKACSNAYNGTDGQCTLLYNCAHVVDQHLISTLDVYNAHFCHIDEYAGICCPKPTVAVP